MRRTVSSVMLFFACGAIQEGDTLHMYYGVADTSMAGCDMKISEILHQLEVENK